MSIFFTKAFKTFKDFKDTWEPFHVNKLQNYPPWRSSLCCYARVTTLFLTCVVDVLKNFSMKENMWIKEFETFCQTAFGFLLYELLCSSVFSVCLYFFFLIKRIRFFVLKLQNYFMNDHSHEHSITCLCLSSLTRTDNREHVRYAAFPAVVL